MGGACSLGRAQAGRIGIGEDHETAHDGRKPYQGHALCAETAPGRKTVQHHGGMAVLISLGQPKDLGRCGKPQGSAARRADDPARALHARLLEGDLHGDKLALNGP